MADTGVFAAPSPTRTDEDDKFNAKDAAGAYNGAASVSTKLEAGKTLIGAVADGSNLTLDPDLDSFYAMDADTVRLPGIVVAAVALGEAAAEAANGQARLVHIAFAVNRLEISAGDANASLLAAMKNNASGQTKAALADLTRNLKTASDALAASGRDLLEGRPVANLDTAQRALLRQVSDTWRSTNTELARLL